ncbi:hypothetical protein PT2222_300005 [Paraburkholderia tropica]
MSDMVVWRVYCGPHYDTTGRALLGGAYPQFLFTTPCLKSVGHSSSPFRKARQAEAEKEIFAPALPFVYSPNGFLIRQCSSYAAREEISPTY